MVGGTYVAFGFFASLVMNAGSMQTAPERSDCRTGTR
jgi:hypothetical protein